jgi:hypothetical protein
VQAYFAAGLIASWPGELIRFYIGMSAIIYIPYTDYENVIISFQIWHYHARKHFGEDVQVCVAVNARGALILQDSKVALLLT